MDAQCAHTITCYISVNNFGWKTCSLFDRNSDKPPSYVDYSFNKYANKSHSICYQHSDKISKVTKINYHCEIRVRRGLKLQNDKNAA